MMIFYGINNKYDVEDNDDDNSETITMVIITAMTIIIDIHAEDDDKNDYI